MTKRPPWRPATPPAKAYTDAETARATAAEAALPTEVAGVDNGAFFN
jgi:hypothetical protein